jgi:hypothetical protein
MLNLVWALQAPKTRQNDRIFAPDADNENENSLKLCQRMEKKAMETQGGQQFAHTVRQYEASIPSMVESCGHQRCRCSSVPKVSIIQLHWKRRKRLHQCLPQTR